jgi:phosphoribosylformimino-5-aminoimidazole carboxamide ribotide isomerase
MKVIPVVDILNGVAVHAVRGKRKEYQPLKSSLCDSADPLEVASAFKILGFTELYIADLDNILGKGTSLPLIEKISKKTKAKIMVDAGISDIKKAQEAFRGKASKIIVGTETLQNLSFVKDAVELFGSERVAVSLDLMDGKVLSKSEKAKSMGALALASEFQEMGVTEIIVLDLAKVGSGEGVDMSQLEEFVGIPKLRVFVGGGVRDIKELKVLKNMGISGVLLATALHTGKISITALKHADMI